MSLKKLGVALLAMVILSAIMSDDASAEKLFKGGGTWNVGGKPSPKVKRIGRKLLPKE